MCRGTALDPVSLKKHVRQERGCCCGGHVMVNEREVARKFSGSNGIILEADAAGVVDRVVPQPDVEKYTDESERLLLKGVIHATPTRP